MKNKVIAQGLYAAGSGLLLFYYNKTNEAQRAFFNKAGLSEELANLFMLCVAIPGSLLFAYRPSVLLMEKTLDWIQSAISSDDEENNALIEELAEDEDDISAIHHRNRENTY